MTYASRGRAARIANGTYASPVKDRMTQMAGNPIDETLAHPGATLLDECLRRDPANIPDSDLDAIIAYSREERTRFALKAQKAEDKKDGIDGTETVGETDRVDE